LPAAARTRPHATVRIDASDLLRFATAGSRPAIAEDIVQEALLRACDPRRSEGSERGASLAADHRTARARPLYERKRLELVSLDEVSRPRRAQVREPGGELFALRHAIMKLPIEYREPLVLQVLVFYHEEIAASWRFPLPPC